MLWQGGFEQLSTGPSLTRHGHGCVGLMLDLLGSVFIDAESFLQPRIRLSLLPKQGTLNVRMFCMCTRIWVPTYCQRSVIALGNPPRRDQEDQFGHCLSWTHTVICMQNAHDRSIATPNNLRAGQKTWNLVKKPRNAP